MAKWEYRVCAIEPGSPQEIEQQTNSRLKTFGEEGWRFVETIYAQHSQALLLFKKAVRAGVKFGSEKSPH